MPSVQDVLLSNNNSNNDSNNQHETIMSQDNGGGQPQIFEFNSMADHPGQFAGGHESLEDHNSTTSSTESGSNIERRKDHEFIPTRMKTISASKPAANPAQFTKVPSNPLLVSAHKQMMQVEEIKKKKEIVRVKKAGDDEPDWQDNLSSWKDKRRKQSEDALQRVAEVKALESDGDDFNSRQKISIGRKLSSLLYTNGDDDWSDLGLEKKNSSTSNLQDKSAYERKEFKKKTSMPAIISNREPPVNRQRTPEADPANDENDENDDPTKLVKSASRTPGGGGEGYGEGVPVLNRKTSAPVMPYGSSEQSAPPIRRKSSELSTTMKSRLEAFNKMQDEGNDDAGKSRNVEPDETFREKLQAFRKISEPQPEDDTPKGPKPPLSYKTLIGSTFSQSNNRTLNNDNSHDDDSVDQLLDDALEESYRSVLEDEGDAASKNTSTARTPTSAKSPPREKPPPPPGAESPESAKNSRNLQHHSTSSTSSTSGVRRVASEEVDKQEQEIIASLANEEREHKKYMETVKAMRNLSPGSNSSSQHSSDTQQQQQQHLNSRMGPTPYGKKNSVSPTFRNVSPIESTSSSQQQQRPIKKKSEQGQQRPYNQQHWLIQEAEQRRITEQQSRNNMASVSSSTTSASSLAQQSPVYENSNYVGGMPVVQQPQQHHPPHWHQGQQQQQQQQQQQYPPPLNENMYANLGQQPPMPSNFQREMPPGPPAPSAGMRGLPGPQVPPRNPDGSAAPQGGNDRLLSVSGKKKCSHCKEELGRGAAMIIESLRLFYHLRCFRCVVCHVQLGNGATGTDVRVRNNKLHCQNCYSNDEGLKFSKV